jgi:signal transduction histidine kinase
MARAGDLDGHDRGGEMSSDPLFVLEREGAEPLALPAGRHVLGAEASLVLDAPGVAAQHVVLTVAAERVFCEARSPQLSFAVNGEDSRSRALDDNDRLEVGEAVLFVRRVTARNIPAASSTIGTTELIHAREEQSTLAQHYERVVSGASANVRQLGLFYRLSQLVSSFDDTERFGDQLLELVLDVIPGRRAFLLLARKDSPPEIVAARPASQREPGPSKTILERVLGEGVSLITADAQHDPRLSDSASIVIGAIRTALCAPLRADEQLLGALYVDTSEHGAAPTAEHLTLLESVASYAALALSRARAYAAMRQRELHAHLLVHDLKNPLSNVLAATDYLEMLLPAPDSEADREALTEILQLIRSSGTRLEGYVSDILAVAQLEESSLTPQRAEHDLLPFAEGLAARWQRALGLRRLKLSVAVEPPDARFAFDGRLIDRVIDNLLDNAVQYAPSDSQLSVRFELAASDDAPPTLRVVVGDQGPGVPPEMRDRVFDKFARVEAKGVGGRGFGLYFCRLAVRAHDGEIAIEGEPGDNRFAFDLRAPELAEAAIATTEGDA